MPSRRDMAAVRNMLVRDNHARLPLRVVSLGLGHGPSGSARLLSEMMAVGPTRIGSASYAPVRFGF